MNLLFLLLLTGVSFIVSILYLVLSAMGKKKRTRNSMLPLYGWAFTSALIVVGLFLWQLGSSPLRQDIVVTGWSKLKPIGPSIAYMASNGEFTVSFINRVGTRIELTNASVTDKLDPSVIWSDPTINDVDPTVSPQIIAAGDSFKLDASDNGAGRHEWDPFDLEITITYEMVMDGIKTSYTETGRIRGPVDY